MVRRIYREKAPRAREGKIRPEDYRVALLTRMPSGNLTSPMRLPRAAALVNFRFIANDVLTTGEKGQPELSDLFLKENNAVQTVAFYLLSPRMIGANGRLYS